MSKVVRYKECKSLMTVEVQCFIWAYVWMIQLFNLDEISLDLQQKLFGNFEFFDSKNLFIHFVLTSINAAIGPFSQLFKKVIFILKTAVKHLVFKDESGCIYFWRSWISLFFITALWIYDRRFRKCRLILNLLFFSQFFHQKNFFQVLSQVA